MNNNWGRNRANNFMEESVGKGASAYSTILIALCWFFIVIFALAAAMLIPTTAITDIVRITIIILLAGAAFGLFLLKDKVVKEYDYTFTNGHIDIAVIYNAKKRKKLVSFSMKNVEIVEHLSEPGFERNLRNPNINKKLNCFAKRGRSLYYVIFSSKGLKYLLVFQPSEAFLKMMKIYNPHAVNIKKFEDQQ